MAAFNHKDLIVWQKAIVFFKECYRLTSEFPVDEKQGLVSQIRRAAVAIPSNIAEGHGRSSTKDYIRFLNIAYGSLCEVETQFVIAARLRYFPPNAECPSSDRSWNLRKCSMR